MNLKVASCPSHDAALTNLVYVNADSSFKDGEFLTIKDFVFGVKVDSRIESGTIGLNVIHRKNLDCNPGEGLECKRYDMPNSKFNILLLNVEISFLSQKKARNETIDAVQLASYLSSCFANQTAKQIFSKRQEVIISYRQNNFALTIQTMVVDGLDEGKIGLLTDKTAFVFEAVRGSNIKITNQKSAAGNSLFKRKDFNFEKLGIGGLDKQFSDIFRRAFASRVFPPSVVAKMGIQHVKGILLFGPPGTGKTLIARQIGKMLNGREPKVVNGPEVLNKYVGQSEENIRKLFADAEGDLAMHGEDSDLHIIIFDEIDAICKQRGSQKDGTGVNDTIVNQLLTKIDGVDALPNILLIGMTNRRDLLDDALMRPGRLEVQIEIGLPDEKGRRQILGIHTSKASEHQYLDSDVDLGSLAARTKNFSGAELEGLVKSAASFALNRQVDVNDLSKVIDESKIKITMLDFENALTEVKPAFGVSNDELSSYLLHGIVDYGAALRHIQSLCRNFVEQVQANETTPLVSFLLEGPTGAGKTALAVDSALKSEFPFVKMVTAEKMVGMSESMKCQTISKTFEDAYKSPLSVIILDEIERILEYVSIGHRFSNTVLQTLLVLVKRMPPPGKKLLVIGTTSSYNVLESMDLVNTFNFSLSVPELEKPSIEAVLEEIGMFSSDDIDKAVEALGPRIPVKRLFLLTEMVKQRSEGEGFVPLSKLQQCLEDLGNGT